MHRIALSRTAMAVFGLIAASLIVSLLSVGGSAPAPASAAKPERLLVTFGPNGPISVAVNAGLEHQAPLRIQAPQNAGDCPVPGVARFESSNWECPNFPQCSSSKWISFDAYASVPGLTDEIRWGRSEGESTVGLTADDAGKYAAWSVGGGTVGRSLSATNKEYPGKDGEICRSQGPCRIYTSLQFNSFEAANVPNGIRILFDYKAKLPTGARFFVAIADFSKRDLGTGQVTLLKTYEAELQRDTADEWVRGMTLPFPEAAGVTECLITFTYINDPATADGYGVFIDNVHLDALFSSAAPPCPSPATPPPPATDTPVVLTPTPTSIVIIRPTKTPTPKPGLGGRVIDLPYVLRGGIARPVVATVVPTAPTPTITPSPSPEPSETPVPTWTARPTDTPQPTPTSTSTPQPVPDLIIDKVIYKKLPGGFAVQVVDLFNQGDGAQEMYRWGVEGTQKVPVTTCRFTDPAFKIEGGEHYYILAGTEADEQSLVEPYLGNSMVCKDQYIFDQNSDAVLLLNDGHDTKDQYCWYQFGPYECSPR